MTSEARSAIDVDGLAEAFQALASPIRLRILLALRTPHAGDDLRVPAGAERAGLRDDRPLHRTTIRHHLDILEAHHVVKRLDDGRYGLDQQRLFALLDGLAMLARLSPVVPLDVGVTLDERPVAEAPPHDGPRFVMAGGPRDAQAYALHGPGPWTIGRDRAADVALDHDPYVSRAHVLVERDGASFRAALAPAASKAALVDQRPLLPGRAVPLTEGAIVSAGASRLVFRT